MNIYLDEIFSNDQSRERFQEFLIKSNFYSISSVFNRIDRFDDFQYERALLYGKVNQSVSFKGNLLIFYSDE